MKQYGINRTARRRVSMGRPCKEELPAIGYLSYTVRETHVTSPKLLEYIIEIKYVRSESIDARTPLSLPFVSRPQIGPRCHRSYTQKRTCSGSEHNMLSTPSLPYNLENIIQKSPARHKPLPNQPTTSSTHLSCSSFSSTS